MSDYLDTLVDFVDGTRLDDVPATARAHLHAIEDAQEHDVHAVVPLSHFERLTHTTTGAWLLRGDCVVTAW